jgi:DNA-binding transcriptional regulator YiaG
MPYKDKDGRSIRCDVRIPNQLYEQIETIARQNNARIRLKSRKPEVTSTIVKLIELGIRHLSDITSDNLLPSDKLSDNISDIIETKVSSVISSKLSEIIEQVLSSDQLFDRISDIVDEKLQTTTEFVISDKLSDKLSDITQKPEVTSSDNSFNFREDIVEHSLPSSTKDQLSDIVSDKLSDSQQQEVISSDKLSDRLSDKKVQDSPKASKEEISNQGESGISSAELAKRFGVTPSSLSRWRTGKRSPKDPSIATLFAKWEFRDNLWYFISS